jgi:hypothetical protein
MTWEKYLFKLGLEFENYYIFEDIFKHLEYFKQCFINGLDPEYALDNFNAWLSGETIFE